MDIAAIELATVMSQKNMIATANEVWKGSLEEWNRQSNTES